MKPYHAPKPPGSAVTCRPVGIARFHPERLIQDIVYEMGRVSPLLSVVILALVLFSCCSSTSVAPVGTKTSQVALDSSITFQPSTVGSISNGTASNLSTALNGTTVPQNPASKVPSYGSSTAITHSTTSNQPTSTSVGDATSTVTVTDAHVGSTVDVSSAATASPSATLPPSSAEPLTSSTVQSAASSTATAHTTEQPTTDEEQTTSRGKTVTEEQTPTPEHAEEETTTMQVPEAGPDKHIGLKVALGVCIPVIIITFGVVILCILKKKMKKTGRGYLTLEDFGGTDGLQNPDYDQDL